MELIVPGEEQDNMHETLECHALQLITRFLYNPYRIKATVNVCCTSVSFRSAPVAIKASHSIMFAVASIHLFHVKSLLTFARHFIL